MDTIVALEKSQSGGNGERSVEVELLEQSLERNKHHFHVDPAKLGLSNGPLPGDLRRPVLYVKKEAGDDCNG